MRSAAALSVLLTWPLLTAAVSRAQGLPPPPTPPGNPVTPAKVRLGDVLFWDEQLSSTRTTACGTCHRPMSGGGDPRSHFAPLASTHPGHDGVFGGDDDVVGSMGLIASNPIGLYVKQPPFPLREQVTPRRAPSVVNAAYAPLLFWDGRADGSFEDPLSGAVVLPFLAALESQAVEPPLSPVEMAHPGRDWQQVAQRIAVSKPLALSPAVPPSLAAWIAGRSYPALFAEAFGSPEVTPARIAFAIASYERTLVSDQSPFDAFLAGDSNALTPEQMLGRDVFFGKGRCFLCHGGPLFTDQSFHNVGLRPNFEDPGRFLVTGDPADLGRFKTPSLRNVALRAPYFHNGRFPTLADVVDFYDRGGDFHVNQDPAIQPLGLSTFEKGALVAFLEALTDPRVALALPPFERPMLYSEGPFRPETFGVGAPGSGGATPRLVAPDPPLLGNPHFAMALADGLGHAPALLLVDVLPAPPGTIIGGVPLYVAGSFALRPLPLGPLFDFGPGEGWTTFAVAIPDVPAALGLDLFVQGFVADPAGPSGLAATAGLHVRLFSFP